MAGFLLSGAVAIAAAALAIVGKAVGTQPATVPVSAFGGSVPVHIAHVGRIDVDLEAAGSQQLQRVHVLRALGHRHRLLRLALTREPSRSERGAGRSDRPEEILTSLRQGAAAGGPEEILTGHRATHPRSLQ